MAAKVSKRNNHSAGSAARPGNSRRRPRNAQGSASRGCKVCRHPKAAEFVRTVLRFRAAGETRRSVLAMHECAREHMGLDCAWETFRQHVRLCERKLWRAGNVRLYGTPE